MKRFRQLLDQLTIGLDAQTITLEQASERMTHYLQGEMQCTQVSVWRFEDSPAGPFLRRDVGYDALTGLMPPAAGMCHPNLAPYVEELTHRGTFASDDAQNDERLAPLRDSLLAPLDIRSLLYATIGANGSTWALLCCAQRGEVRHWSPQEIRTLKAYADAISLRRVRRRRREAEAASLAQRLFQVQGASREHPLDPIPSA
jgi:GAF domain-containing protein